MYTARSKWFDASGRFYTTETSALTPTNSIITSAVALSSNAGLGAFTEGLRIDSVPAPVSATYKSVSDRAVLFFQTDCGSLISLSVPAPKQALFLADLETVNPVAAAAIIAACVGRLVAPDSSTAQFFVGGNRAKIN